MLLPLTMVVAAATATVASAAADTTTAIWTTFPMTAVVSITNLTVFLTDVSQPHNNIPRVCYRTVAAGQQRLPIGWFGRNPAECDPIDTNITLSDQRSRARIPRRLFRARAPYVDAEDRYRYVVLQKDPTQVDGTGGVAYAIEFAQDLTCTVWQYTSPNDQRCIELMMLARLAQRSDLFHNATWPPLDGKTFGSLDRLLNDTVNLVGGNRTLPAILNALRARTQQLDGRSAAAPAAADDDYDDDEYDGHVEYVDENIEVNNAAGLDYDSTEQHHARPTNASAPSIDDVETVAVVSRGWPGWTQPRGPTVWLDVASIPTPQPRIKSEPQPPSAATDIPLPEPSSVIMTGQKPSSNNHHNPSPDAAVQQPDYPVPFTIGMIGGIVALLLMLVTIVALACVARRNNRCIDSKPSRVRRGGECIYGETTRPLATSSTLKIPPASAHGWVFGTLPSDVDNALPTTSAAVIGEASKSTTPLLTSVFVAAFEPLPPPPPPPVTTYPYGDDSDFDDDDDEDSQYEKIPTEEGTLRRVAAQAAVAAAAKARARTSSAALPDYQNMPPVVAAAVYDIPGNNAPVIERV